MGYLKFPAVMNHFIHGVFYRSLQICASRSTGLRKLPENCSRHSTGAQRRLFQKFTIEKQSDIAQ